MTTPLVAAAAEEVSALVGLLVLSLVDMTRFELEEPLLSIAPVSCDEHRSTATMFNLRDAYRYSDPCLTLIVN